MLKVAIPHVKVNRIARRGAVSPQLPGLKTNRIQVLWLLAQKMRVCIREHEYAMVADDSTLFASSGCTVLHHQALSDSMFC